MIFSVDKYASIRLKSKISLLIVELYFITPSVTVVVALIKLMRVKTNKLGGIYFPDSEGEYMIKATSTNTTFPSGANGGGIQIHCKEQCLGKGPKTSI